MKQNATTATTTASALTTPIATTVPTVVTTATTAQPPVDIEESDTVAWTPDIDKLLAGWCDQAKCYEWMHSEAYDTYEKKARAIMLTINIFVAVSGLSNIIAGSTIVNGFQTSWLFGSLTIIISLMNMLQDKLGWQVLANTNRQQENVWGNIVRKLEEELLLPPSSRKDCATFLRTIRADINNASTDSATMIPRHIRVNCYNRFKDISDFEMPEICGKVEHTRIYVGDLQKTDSAKEPLISSSQ